MGAKNPPSDQDGAALLDLGFETVRRQAQAFPSDGHQNQARL
jgi:hypothetical protein